MLSNVNKDRSATSLFAAPGITFLLPESHLTVVASSGITELHKGRTEKEGNDRVTLAGPSFLEGPTRQNLNYVICHNCVT